jgi:cyclic 2,3-diphosphoglycerate synthetase
LSRENGGVSRAAIVLVDGEHHPAAVREAIDRVDAERGVAGVVFCGGEEKLGPGPLDGHYGRPVRSDPEAALRDLAGSAAAVVDLADEPVLPAGAKLKLAALALHLGLSFETPGGHLNPPRYEPVAFAGPKLAVIGTGKRTGKTAVAGHWAGLMREREPVIVCMGRGGPAEPRLASADTALDDLLAVVQEGGHGASDYLEDAVLAGVRTVGCRRVGGGLAGEPAESNVPAGGVLAASLEPGAIIFEGSGACVPPVEVDRTVCIVGADPPEPFAEYRILRADLVLTAGDHAPAGALRFGLRPEPAEPLPEEARVALFTTGAPSVPGLEPAVASTNLARRSDLEADLKRAESERCDLYLTELKAAAIDTVARHARERDARVIFVRNRPIGIEDDLDAALLRLMADG